MPEQEYIFEYELIDISFDQGYELPEDGVMWCVSEDAPSRNDEHKSIEYDADGIPMGNSIPEIEQREVIIRDFFEKWSTLNNERRIFNDILQEYIYVRAVSVIEAKEHSAKSYKSTRAIMIIDEVLKNASPIRRVSKKTDNKNQKDFAYMLVMIYKHQDIGTIKLTVGVRPNAMKIQYGLTALRPGQPLIDETINKTTKKTKKRNPRK
jgi:hypothetical protein